MRYELSHDSIARQILDRVSADAKARRQAALLVQRAFARYEERDVLLTQEDLDEIRPYEAGIQFSDKELAFIQKSKQALQKAARRKRQIIAGIISVLSIFLLIALWQWRRSVASSKALEARILYESGYTSQAFRTAQAAWKTLGADQGTRQTIGEVLQDITQSGLERDLIHEEEVLHFDIDREEKHLLSILRGKQAVLWDLPGRKQLLTLSHPDTLLNGAILPWEGETKVVTICENNTAYFWDINGELLFQKEFSEPIKGFDLSAQLKLILLWSEQQIMVLSDSANIWPETVVSDQIINADLAPDGEYLLVATQDSVKSQWLVPYTMGATLRPEFSVKKELQMAEYVGGDDGNLKVLIQFDDESVQIINNSGFVDTSSHYRFFSPEIDKLFELRKIPIKHIKYSPVGHNQPKILFQTDSTSLYYWSAYRYDVDQQAIGNIDFYTRYDEPVTASAFSQQDGYLLIASADGRVDIWESAGGTYERKKRWRTLMQEVRFFDNDRQIISTAGDKTIKIWKLNAQRNNEIERILHNYNTTLQVFD